MTSPADMYVDDKATEEPSGKTSSSRTRKSTKSRNGDSTQEDLYCQEKQLQERILSLEQEVLTLLLENNQFGVTKAGLGQFLCFQVLWVVQVCSLLSSEQVLLKFDLSTLLYLLMCPRV